MYKLTLAFLLATAVAASAEIRTWTSSSGSTLEAELVEYANRTVVLKTAKGRRVVLPLQKLTQEDQVRITQWADGQEKTKLAASGQRSSNKDEETERAVGGLKPGLAELLPENLLDASGKEVSRDKLAGKTVGFYFSAHWCPPCRTFTPRLVDFRDDNKDDFEIVFVSSDRSPQAQMDYMKETNMKWLALPHRSAEGKKLAGKYGISGIPSLVIVSPDGETITKNGRGDVSGNPKGALASWTKTETTTPTATGVTRPKEGRAVKGSSKKSEAGLAELLPENILDPKGKEVSRDNLAGKVVGFYFSAHWCPPCRTFTPSLVKFRDDNKDDFEVVFVSSDKSPQAQMEYMEETKMKWFTLPHRGEAANRLAGKFGIRGIPSLIIVSPDGETITKNGRGDVSGNPKGALASWKKSI